MEFRFTNMVGAGTPIKFGEQNGDIHVCDDSGKCYLQVVRSGDMTRDSDGRAARCYVAFS